MRVVIQRVAEAHVKVNAEIVGEIGNGLLILLGIEEADTEEDILWLINKIINRCTRANIINQSIYIACEHKKGQPPILHQSGKARISQTNLPSFLSIVTFAIPRQSGMWYFWCRYESEPDK